MKYVDFRTGESKDLSEWEAYKIKNETPKEEQVPLKEWDFLRTKDFVIYVLNKRTRTRYSIKIKRCLALLAEKHNCLMKYYEKDMVAYTEDGEYFYIFADRVRNQQELEYHSEKFKDKYIYKIKNKMVICLQKSDLVPYIELDFDTIREYYKGFVFPTWFRPLTKMKHFRFMNIKMHFVFGERRYTDSSKRSMDSKIRHDLLKMKDVAKVYWGIFRFLDSRLESKGLGYPIDLLVPVLDIDGSCNKIHLIDERGICVKCLKDSDEKLEKVKKRISEIEGLNIYKILFSGSKGWHVYLEYNGKRELHQEELLNIINHINKRGTDEEENLVDTFIFERNGEEVWDKHRIMKLVSTIDATSACKVSEEIQRLPVKDTIVNPAE